MKYGVLGTGDVVHTIAGKLIELGHEVMMGSRTATNEKAIKWVEVHGAKAKCGLSQIQQHLVKESLIVYKVFILLKP
ncbi:hypothetical protein BCR36DRAFT_587667 [Piromyces finnis]|uniref:Pyrroline-5-carboxylate reductase catalytic N-terminal domain-containing protein n=1 Tax=Piromyces finnis TaxID=1754191 RepID=A0A1Y1UW76_9FUNG|nr:hypothetical protein BCR36DRAFT_587667 [Piromyces finnis]|eukprot:ORX41866.1 hypothetical protein BCR36DRAFT_587667 [Piromyces finnis]